MKALLLAALSGAAAFSSGYGENLLENGGFELPKITGRTPEEKGGNPARVDGKTAWDTLTTDHTDKGGKLSVGVTDEIARTGKQALFVDFERLTAPSRQVSLVTTLVPVKPSQSYRISIWGRIDGKRPLTLDQRRPYVWIDVQFLKADRDTEAGEAQLGVQMIPGSIVPGATTGLTFVSSKWSESVALVETPKDTAFLQVTWTWGVPRDEGETDGMVFWDDAAVEDYTPPPAPNPKEAPSPTAREHATGAPGKPPVTTK
jgi:hypothetical protein